MMGDPLSQTEEAADSGSTRASRTRLDRLGAFAPLASKLLSWIDRVLPPALRSGDSDVRRRARLLVLLLASTIAVSSLMVVAEVFTGPALNVAVGSFVLGISVLMLIGVRVGLSNDRASTLLIGALYLTSVGMTLATGGRAMAALVWIPILPMIAILLSGPRSCLHWTLASFVGLLATALLVVNDVPLLLADYESSWDHVRFAVIALVLGYAAALGLVFEWLRGEALHEAKATRDALSASEKHYRRIAENAGDMVVELDQRLHWRYVSPVCKDILGWNAESLLGLGFMDRLHPDDVPQLRRQLRELQRVGGTCRLSARLRCADGRWLAVESSVKRFETSQGMRHIVAIIRDVSDLRRAELVVRHNERLASTGTLAAGIAHQINNPVGAILASAQYALMCAEDGDDSQLESALQENVDHARRCGEIVRGLLQFASGQSTLRRTEDLLEILGRARELIRVHARERGVSIELVGPADPIEVEVNAIEIEQVVVNLVQNAVEAEPRSGRVHIQLARAGGVARLEVSDDGRGIGEADRAHVFDPFFTTRIQEGASGLGLSVAHGIVQEHGGRIELHSEPGTGTRVRVELPLRDGGTRRASASKFSPSARPPGSPSAP
jgi:PAS domain S-box-containing protein